MKALRISTLILLAVIATVGLMLWLPWVQGPDAALIRAGLIASVTRVPLAMATLLFSMRAMDWLAHRRFRDDFVIIEGSPHALAIYHAARLVAVCLLLASLFG